MVTGGKTKEASAPGQIFLFGEHAVVYGQPALAASIGVKTHVRTKLRDDRSIEIDSEGVAKISGFVEEKQNGYQFVSEEEIGELEFIVKVIELVFNYLDTCRGLNITISSDLPLGSGLGSSSAVTTATAASLSSALGSELDRSEIAEIAYEAELEVQGAASKTGVNVAAFGGFLKVREEELEKVGNIPELNITIGYTGVHGDTGEQVRHVKELRKSNPKIINPIILTIGDITEIGVKALKQKNMEKAGALMNVNQNLLEALEVSSPELRTLIEASRSAGAYGAKLTGGGGGGCIVALSKADTDIAGAIEDSGGDPIRTKIGTEGLKY